MTFTSEYSSRAAIYLSSDEDARRSARDAFRSGMTSSKITQVPGLLTEVPGYASSRSDQHLVIAAQSGCPTAFNELWNLYSRRVFRTAFNITKNTQDAEDALQDSFLRAFLAFGSFEGRASFYSWVTRIAINSALGILRKRRSHPETSLNPASPREDDSTPVDFRDSAPNPEQTCDQLQRRAKLLRAIRKLPSNLRDAVHAVMTEDCSVREVADRLKISEAAAKSRLYRARTRLGTLTASRDGRKVQRQHPAGLEAFPGRFLPASNSTNRGHQGAIKTAAASRI
jgi:RNA polymerase sigma-70 factor, ECF subfamily